MASSIISWKITYQHNNRLVIEINLENTLEEKPEGVYELSETITNLELNKTVDIDLTIKDDRRSKLHALKTLMQSLNLI